MSDTKYDSVLVGWADDPKFNDNNELMSWSVRLKDNELKDMLDQYVTRRDEARSWWQCLRDVVHEQEWQGLCPCLQPE